MLQILCFILLSSLYQFVAGEESGYSFYKFSGPVSGQVHQINVHYPHLNKNVIDYVAKPDYSYSFGVEDPHSGNSQQRQESRDGDSVKGEYSLLQSDGTIRTVKYVADPVNGFQATVHYSPQQSPQSPQAPHQSPQEPE